MIRSVISGMIGGAIGAERFRQIMVSVGYDRSTSVHMTETSLSVTTKLFCFVFILVYSWMYSLLSLYRLGFCFMRESSIASSIVGSFSETYVVLLRIRSIETDNGVEEKTLNDRISASSRTKVHQDSLNFSCLFHIIDAEQKRNHIEHGRFMFSFILF